MVTCTLGNRVCTAIAITWEKVWRIRFSASDSLVRGSTMGWLSDGTDGADGAMGQNAGKY